MTPVAIATWNVIAMRDLGYSSPVRRFGDISVVLFLGLFVGSLTAVSLASTAPVSPYLFESLFQKHRPALLRLRTEAASGPIYTSGFLVRDDGLVLSTTRVTEGGGAISVVDAQGALLAARIVAQDRALGVVVLALPSAGGLATLDLGSNKALAIDDWLVGMGYDAKGQAEARAGCVSKRWLAKPNEKVEHYLVDLAVTPGGPLLDLNGKVVAMVLRPRGARRTVVLGIDSVKPLLLRAARHVKARD